MPIVTPAVFDGINGRFGKDESLGSDHVAKARSGMAFGRILVAKQHWQAASRKAELLAIAIKGLKSALLACQDDDRAMMLGNLGYALLLSGNSAAAAEPTRECLRKRGFIRVDARRLGIGMGCKAVFAANIEIFSRKPTPQTARAK